MQSFVESDIAKYEEGHYFKQLLLNRNLLKIHF